MVEQKKILVIAAHPDDEILGCGGTMARLTSEEHLVYTLILGEGITSRSQTRQPEKVQKELAELKRNILTANYSLGVKEIISLDFPDNRFDSVPLLDIVKEIEKIKTRIKPDTIFTHYENDLNIDHQVTFRAVLTATRPLPDETVKEILSFEVLSSTEWNFPSRFDPNYFVDITKTLDAKLEAMKQYAGELRVFPHPRSLEGIKAAAQTWGMKNGVKSAEAFKLIRALV